MTAATDVVELPPELHDVAFRAQRAARWTEMRDQGIREAHAAGYSLRQIAQAAGLSHGTIDAIVKRAG